MRSFIGFGWRVALFWGLWGLFGVPACTLVCLAVAGDDPEAALTLFLGLGRLSLLVSTLVLLVVEWVLLRRHLGSTGRLLRRHGERVPGRLDGILLHPVVLVVLWGLWVVLQQLQALWSSMGCFCFSPVAAVPWAVATALIGALTVGRLTLTRFALARRRLPAAGRVRAPALFPLTVAAWSAAMLLVAFVRLPHLVWVQRAAYVLVMANVAAQGAPGPESGGRVELLVELGADDDITEVLPSAVAHDARVEQAVPGASPLDEPDMARTWVLSAPLERAPSLWWQLVSDTENVQLAELNTPVTLGPGTTPGPCALGTGDLPVNDPLAQDLIGLGAALQALPPARAQTQLAVVDSGIDDTHEDLRGVVVGGGRDTRDHGTSVAGVAAAIAHNARGIASTNLGGRYIRVIDVDTLAERNPAADDVAHGVSLAVRKGAGVILIAAGGPGPAPAVVKDAIVHALARDAVVVVAAGNRGGVAGWPANVPGVVAVGATERGRTAPFSGSTRKLGISVAAPGVDVCAPLAGGGYGLRTGTSFAAPAVAGVIAAYRSICPDARGRDVVERLVATAGSGGMVRAERMLGGGGCL